MNGKASLSVVMAGVLWGMMNIFVKNMSAAGLDSEQIAGIRMLVAVILFTAIVFIKDRSKLKIRPKDIWMFIGTGIVSLVLFNICYFYTIIHGQASIAVVLLYTSPIFIMLLSAILFKEKITGRKLMALVLTFAGCLLVAGLIGGEYQLSGMVLLTGVLSGFLYSLYTIFGRFALEKYDTLTVTAYTFIFGFIGTIPISGYGKTFRLFAESPYLILWSIGIGIVCTIMPYFLYTWGLQRIESGKAAILVAVEPVVGAVIGMTVFKENHNALKIIGICCIIAAIVLLNIHELPSRKNKTTADRNN